jgi:hypothetical protein
MCLDREEVKERTLKLAQMHAEATVGDLGWKLVRMWKNYKGAQPEDFDWLLPILAEKFDRPVLDLRNAVDYAWEKAETADEEVIWSEAYMLATKNPIEVSGRCDDSFRLAVSTISYVAREKNGKPFHVPAEKLAKLLGFSATNKGDAVRKILARMQQRTLIECVDSTYKPGVKGKLYIWTGDQKEKAEIIRDKGEIEIQEDDIYAEF